MDELAAAFEQVRMIATAIIVKGDVQSPEYRLALAALQTIGQFASSVEHEKKMLALEQGSDHG